MLKTHDMRRVPEHSHLSSPVLPWLPLPAMLGFTLLGIGGSLLLTYTTFSFAEAKRPTHADHATVYEARAVPFDTLPESPAQRAAAISRALTSVETGPRRLENLDSNCGPKSSPVFGTDPDRRFPGFNAFSAFAAANNYLAVTGASFGIAAQSAPSGFAAPDAVTVSMAAVPETSTWMCGGLLFVLVAARGARAHWHRKRRR